MDNLDERKALNFNHYNSYDTDDEETIGLYSGDNIDPFEKYSKKYIEKNRFVVYFLLKMANPLKKVKMFECTTQNILDVAYTKKYEHNNCIYIFYYSKSNKVKSIKYFG
jgi:hypothetical protein